MIDLTPLFEVRKKKGDFPRSVRGYERALVDDFLDLVSERLEEVVKENMTLMERVARLEEEVANYKERERSLTEALLSAQELREEVRRQSAKDAELLRREAELEAANIQAAAVQAREKEEDALRRLRARRVQLLESYRTFLERELAELAVMEKALEASAEAPAPAAPAGKAPGIKAAPPSVTAPPAPSAKAAPVRERAVARDKAEPETDWLSSIIEEEP